ncbi:MAG: hypothetical protein JXJ22_15750 [Bacteroidales bacterium]|nr:hypothetical protein [Bacteroidales bacterium]
MLKKYKSDNKAGTTDYFLKIISIVLFFLFTTEGYSNKTSYDIIVAQDGSGDFTSLTDAVESLPMYNYERVVILIKTGIYNEKIRLETDYITLVGEHPDSVVIQFSQLREDWIKTPDNIGPAVINIHGDDIILKNLTIINTQPETDKHAFTIYGNGTRTILLNCRVISRGGDTVSLWNYKEGMYYHAGCYFEGAVDFVCPRGWCYIRDSEFYEVKETATIWHAAPVNRDQKFVLENCRFDGVQGFMLGRHHYDAQFFLLHCNFSKTLVDKPIWRVTYPDEPEKNRPYLYGDRYYYYQCSREGGNFNWFGDNVDTWPGKILPEQINARWTFDGKWDPENKKKQEVNGFKIEGKNLILYFNELVGIRGNVVLKTSTGKRITYSMGRGRDILTFTSDQLLSIDDFTQNSCELISGEIYAVTASVNERNCSNFLNLGKCYKEQ